MNTSDLTVERTIQTMWERYDGPLHLDDLAASVFLSKFHYSRVFVNTTGTTPARFLTAVRLFMAKRLLLETDSSVTDVSYGVGYNSVGTFTSRFTYSVGVSPSRYRALTRKNIPRFPSSGPIGPSPSRSVVTGRVRGLAGTDGDGLRIYVAAFKSPMIEGVPQDCVIMDTPGRYRLDLPDGVWFVRAAGVSTQEPDEPTKVRQPLVIGEAAPLRVSRGRSYQVDLAMRPLGPLDLPILLALPELDNLRRPRVAGLSNAL